MSWLIYLTKVILLLGFGLLIYRWFLDREPQGQLKRIYLLSSLLLAHLLPLLPVAAWDLGTTSMLSFTPDSPPMIVLHPKYELVLTTPPPHFNLLLMLIIGLYTVGLLIGLSKLWRFFRRIARQRQEGEIMPYQKAFLVALPEAISPHTFGAYIFYQEGTSLSPEVLAHEYAHAGQWHSLDRVVVALLQVLFWFNPLLYAYDRAIQLNHECLADRSALATGVDLRKYQKKIIQVLSNADESSPVLASGLDFHFTKKRILMLQAPKKSKQLITFKCLTAIGCWLMLSLLFGGQISAQTNPLLPPPPPPAGEMGEARTGAIYVDPTTGESFRLSELPRPEARTPTAAEWEAWLDSKDFGIWLDGERIENGQLKEMDKNDIAYYVQSRLLPNAVNFGEHTNQLDLMSYIAFREWVLKTWGEQE